MILAYLSLDSASLWYVSLLWRSLTPTLQWEYRPCTCYLMNPINTSFLFYFWSPIDLPRWYSIGSHLSGLSTFCCHFIILWVQPNVLALCYIIFSPLLPTCWYLPPTLSQFSNTLSSAILWLYVQFIYLIFIPHSTYFLDISPATVGFLSHWDLGCIENSLTTLPPHSLYYSPVAPIRFPIY